MSIITELEQRFNPHFRRMAEEIVTEFPKVHTNVWSYPIGALTDYRGHGLGVECSIPTDITEPANQAQMEFVALMIYLKHLDREPRIDMVMVSWGNGLVEAKLSPESVEITETNLAEIEKHLPELFGVLKSAVARGHPAAE